VEEVKSTGCFGIIDVSWGQSRDAERQQDAKGRYGRSSRRL
jgi:hypothetical protein